MGAPYAKTAPTGIDGSGLRRVSRRATDGHKNRKARQPSQALITARRELQTASEKLTLFRARHATHCARAAAALLENIADQLGFVASALGREAERR